MGFDKGHHEFHAVDMQAGWRRIPGYPAPWSKNPLTSNRVRLRERLKSSTPLVMFPLPSAVKLPTVATYPLAAPPPFMRNAYCPTQHLPD